MISYLNSKLSKIENQKVRLTLENFLAYQPYHLEIPSYTKKIFLEYHVFDDETPFGTFE